MTDTDIPKPFVIGARKAMKPRIDTRMTVHFRVTRRAVWMYKLRVIWSVIRSKPTQQQDSHDG